MAFPPGPSSHAVIHFATIAPAWKKPNRLRRKPPGLHCSSTWQISRGSEMLKFRLSTINTALLISQHSERQIPLNKTLHDEL